MKKGISCIFLLCFVSLFIKAQPVNFQKTYDTLGYYLSSCVRQTLDHGFIMCGSNYNMTNAQDAAIIKSDSLGNLIWVRTFGGVSTDGAITLEITNDTNYFVWGIKNNFNTYQEELWFLKLNSSGDTVFSRNLSFGPGQNFPKASDRTFDNGYILTGYTNVRGNGLQDIFLIKLNSQGDTVWTKTYGGISTDISYDVKQTTDSGYIITGGTTSFNVQMQDIYTIKTDRNGDTLWTSTFGFANIDCGYGITETIDNGYIVAGTSYDTGGTNYNIILLKYNSIGQLLWNKEFFIPLEDEPVAIFSLNSGGYIICGTTTNPVTLKYQVLLMRIDDFGDSLWTRNYSQSINSYDKPYSMILCSDGGFAIAGESDGPPHDQGLLIKTDSSGNLFSSIPSINITYRPIIFPNPCSDFFIIELGKLIKNDVNYEIFDFIGRLVNIGKIESENILSKIDVHNFASGVYYIKLIDKNSYYYIGKFIVSR